MPTSHKIALLLTLAASLVGLRYLCQFLAVHGGLTATIIVIAGALALAHLIEPNPAQPPDRSRER